MLAARLPVPLPSLIIGETGQWNLYVVDENEAPVDITGATMQLVATQDAQVIATLTIGAGIVVQDAEAGWALATWQTAGLSPGGCMIILTTNDTSGRVHKEAAYLRLLAHPATS